MFAFIEAEKAGRQNVAKTCELLEVSRSAFYEWSKHVPCRRQLDDEELWKRIEEIHAGSRETYGAPRVHEALRHEGICCSRKRVARIMAQRGVIGRCRRRRTTTTVSDPEAQAVDLVKRAFAPGSVELDRVYVGDITYIWTWEGWLYLASVIDLASRRVVGWAMADHMRAELVCDALQMALDIRRPPPGLIFHSDRGTQYTSAAYRRLAEANGVVQSFSRPRQCWDNAVAESWFSTLKLDLIERRSWPTRAATRRAVFE
jgi:putative transposase